MKKIYQEIVETSKKHKNTTSYSIFMLLISSITIISIILFRNSVNIFKIEENSLEFRTIYVDHKDNALSLTDEEKESIKEIRYITDVYDGEPSDAIIHFYMGGIPDDIKLTRRVPENLPKVTYGRPYTEDEKYALVCPLSYYNLTNLSNVDKKAIFNLKDQLNRGVPVEYYQYTYNPEEDNYIKTDTNYDELYTIVGLIEKSPNLMAPNECYINASTSEKIYENQYKKAKEEKRDYEISTGKKITNSPFYVIVNKRKNINRAINKLNQLGYSNITTTNPFSKDTYNILFISRLASSISLVAVFILSFIISLSRNNKKINEKKASLVSVKQVSNIIYVLSTIYSNILIFIISTFIPIFITIVLFNKFTILKGYDLLIGLNVGISNYLLAFLYAVVVPNLLTLPLLKKKSKPKFS